jgi:hypothetical protein
MAAYKMAAVKVTPPNDFPLGLIGVTYGCYPSIPHALRFTKDGKGLMPHPVFCHSTIRRIISREIGHNGYLLGESCGTYLDTIWIKLRFF